MLRTFQGYWSSYSTLINEKDYSEDIERMKASATAIAASLTEFGKTLRETEIPNDADSTARILELQTAEKMAIKEEFKIAVRKGFTLLKSVRQLDKKPTPEQLSPTRLHNVTAIERMLVQLGTYY
ncbi:unnamed protein product [Caenorhabditis sp. 36 PRJEB53466]|nr:unnamed protein product [Caenorhabditis sp. 36 PRJEB53466]